MTGLGPFAEGFAAWRRMLGAVQQAEAQRAVFADAVVEVAGFVEDGLDRAAAADELADMAASIGWDDADAVQAEIAGAFAKVNGPDQVPDDWSDLEEDRRPDAGNGRATSPQIPVQHSRRYMEELTPPEYLVEQLLQRRFLYALTGKTGAGKTAITLYLSACVALGRPIGDMEVTQGNVLYLAGENPDDVRYRWCAMAQQMDFSINDIPVWFAPKRVKLSECWPSLLEQCRRIGDLALVVVDTSAAYFEGDEVNSNTQQGNHARMLRGLIDLPGGPCVIVNCHPVKNAAVDNLIPLGAGAFLNEIDGNLTCAVEGSTVELHWQGKIRGADFAPVGFELRTVTHERLVTTTGRLMPTVICQHLSDAALEGMQQAALGDADLVLREVKNDPRASIAEYATRLGWSFRSGKPAKSRVQRALGKLQKAKLITLELGQSTVTAKGDKRLQQ